MGRDRAAYMRAYRAKRLSPQTIEARHLATEYVVLSNDQADRIRDLEAEVARLKRELATRATVIVPAPQGVLTFTRDFGRSSPAPKPGHR